LKGKIPQTLESEDISESRQQLIEKYTESEKNLMKEFEEKIKKENFVLRSRLKVGESTRPDLLHCYKWKTCYNISA
jgi:hypothetical protein